MDTKLQFPETLDPAEAGAGFEEWWGQEGHFRHDPSCLEHNLKQVARDAWNNSRHEMVKRVRRYAELYLYAPFPTSTTEELLEDESYEQATERFVKTYGKYEVSSVVTQKLWKTHLTTKISGELAAITYYEKLEADLDGLKFLSDAIGKHHVIFDDRLTPKV